MNTPPPGHPVPVARWRVTLPIPLPGTTFDQATLHAALLKRGRDSLHCGGVPAELSLDLQLAGSDAELSSEVQFSEDPGEKQRHKADHLLLCDAGQVAWRPHLIWPAQPLAGAAP